LIHGGHGDGKQARVRDVVEADQPKVYAYRLATSWPEGFRVASGWGRNPPWSCFASVDTRPARGNCGLQGIDPGFRLPPTNICGHFPCPDGLGTCGTPPSDGRASLLYLI
jgi:hypothetical protein